MTKGITSGNGLKLPNYIHHHFCTPNNSITMKYFKVIKNISQILWHKNPRLAQLDVPLDTNLPSCISGSSTDADESSIWPVRARRRRARPLNLDAWGLPTAQPSCSVSTLTQPQSPQHFAHPTAFRAIIRRLSAAMPPIMLWSVKLTSFWARCQDKGGQGNEIGKTEYFSTWLVMS